nr:immunoglobulin heavy chain junction region [Homo sapiens]
LRRLREGPVHHL